MTSRRRSKKDTAQEDSLNIWQASSDLISNAFLILNLFLFISLIQSNLLFRSNNDLKRASEQQLSAIKAALAEAEKKNQQLTAENAKLKSPPVVLIRDNSNRNFESGSATLSSALSRFIHQNLVSQLQGYAEEYNLQGYVVEVIGHTDGQVIRQNSNLDTRLEEVTSGDVSISELSAGSNADLGLMRALSVVRVLEENSELQELGLTFRAYSAAQLYKNNDGDYAPKMRGNDQEDPRQQKRRRIEIRFTPPGQVR